MNSNLKSSRFVSSAWSIFALASVAMFMLLACAEEVENAPSVRRKPEGASQTACRRACDNLDACGNIGAEALYESLAQCNQICTTHHSAVAQEYGENCGAAAEAVSACMSQLSCVELDAFIHAGSTSCDAVVVAERDICVEESTLPNDDEACADYCETAVSCLNEDLNTCVAECEGGVAYMEDSFGAACRNSAQGEYACLGGLTCSALENSEDPSCLQATESVYLNCALEACADAGETWASCLGGSPAWYTSEAFFDCSFIVISDLGCENAYNEYLTCNAELSCTVIEDYVASESSPDPCEDEWNDVLDTCF